MTAKTFAGKLKVSLHGDEAWQLAFTGEHARQPDSLVPPGHDRVMWKFDPTEFEEGRRLAFAIGVVRGALRPRETDAKEDPETIVVEDRWDLVTVAKVWMTEPGVVLDPGFAHLDPPMPLVGGRQVWVTVASEEIEPQEPEPAPDAVIMKIMRPEEHDVSCPGVLLVGANWSS
ncbi:MAG TPA: hypothetical protein VK507_15760 [Iamia sp.]|nr:hypothetical protein [Iamia sp.]